mmetsp:Transcript_1422/g.2679  ORF Transcript_1422/g.2679 Transcript_1422/m.2679 type:complete len:305 (-) Transcript_1422:900-1814(-)
MDIETKCVFVAGATGYVGQAVALAFRRAGYRVVGLARTESRKTQILRQNEITVIFGDVAKPETYATYVQRADVVVQAACDYSNMAQQDKSILDVIVNAVNSGEGPLTVLYTSGAWVYGDRFNDELITESSPWKAPPLVAWRARHEEAILSLRNASGIVIRPGCIYGKSGSLTAAWFARALAGSIKYPGTGQQRWSLIHVDDVAAAYVAAAERGARGEAYNICDPSNDSISEVLDAVVAAAAARTGQTATVEFVPPTNAFEDCLAMGVHMDAFKARDKLQWAPAHTSFKREVDTYLDTYLAHLQP